MQIRHRYQIFILGFSLPLREVALCNNEPGIIELRQYFPIRCHGLAVAGDGRLTLCHFVLCPFQSKITLSHISATSNDFRKAKIDYREVHFVLRSHLKKGCNQSSRRSYVTRRVESNGGKAHNPVSAVTVGFRSLARHRRADRPNQSTHIWRRAEQRPGVQGCNFLFPLRMCLGGGSHCAKLARGIWES